MSACDCAKCAHYEADGTAPAAPRTGNVVQVHVSSPGIGDHMTALCASAGLKIDGKEVVLSVNWKAAPWVELFEGYEVLTRTPWEDVETFRPWDAAQHYERRNRRRPRWEWFALACKTTPAIPDAKPLPALDVFRSMRYRGRVALAPWSAWKYREWPRDYWRELERMLIEGGEKCVVLGAKEHNASGFRSPAVLGERPQFVAAILQSCKLLIGNDSGLCHVAGMLHAPAVALCGPTNGKAVFSYPSVDVMQAPDNHLPNLTPAEVASKVLGHTPASPWPVVEGAGKTRHLLYHLYPRVENGGETWRWNVEQLKQRLPLFNGRKVVAVVTDNTSHSADAVRNAMGRPDVEIVELPNDPGLWEVASFEALFGRLAGNVGPEDAIFYAHGKGVTRGTSTRRWAEVLYETNLDYWPLVRSLLRTHPVAGALKRVGCYRPADESESAWHYSGSFFWLRGDVLALPDWRRIDRSWFGIEMWPSLHVAGCYAATTFHADSEPADAHYRPEYWRDTIEPEYAAWKAVNAPPSLIEGACREKIR